MFRSRWRPSQQAAGPACRGVRACSSAGWERPLACSSLTGVAGVWLEGPRSVTSSQGSSPCPAPSISSFLHGPFGGTSQSSVTCPPPTPHSGLSRLCSWVFCLCTLSLQVPPNPTPDSLPATPSTVVPGTWSEGMFGVWVLPGPLPLSEGGQGYMQVAPPQGLSCSSNHQQ